MKNIKFYYIKNVAEWQFGYIHDWYDYQWHSVWIGPIAFGWEGWPFLDI